MAEPIPLQPVVVAEAFGAIIDAIEFLEDAEVDPFEDRLMMRDLGKKLAKLKDELWDAYQALIIVDRQLPVPNVPEKPSPNRVLQARRVLLGLGFIPCQQGTPKCFKTALLGVRHCRAHASEEEIAEAADNQERMISELPQEQEPVQ